MRMTPTVPKTDFHTPFSPASSITSPSPPLSPKPYDADASSGAEDELTDIEEDLGSFVLVPPESHDDETSSSSTIGTSLRDSMIAGLSDTSASPSVRGSISGGSIAGDESDHEEPVLPEGNDEGNMSFLGESFTSGDIHTQSSDWDGASTVQLGDSVQSHIKLIFPDPTASIISSEGTATASDGTTPSGSLANLIPGSRGVREISSLNASRFDRWTNRGKVEEASLWTISPEIEEMIDAFRPYQRLGSSGNLSGLMKESAFTGNLIDMEGLEGRNVSKDEESAHSFKSNSTPPRNREIRRALDEMASSALGTLGKKWGIVAIASVLSLALLGTVGPNVAFSRSRVVTPTCNSSMNSSENLSFAESSFQASGNDLASSLIPDLISIKQAISTFSTATHKALVPDIIPTKDLVVSTAESVSYPTTAGKRRKRTSIEKTTKSVSVRNEDVALTLLPAPHKQSLSIIPKRLRGRLIMDKRQNITRENSSNAENLSTALFNRYSFFTVNGISEALALAKNHSLSIYSAMDLLYGPILAALERELSELYRLTRKLIRISSEASTPVLEQASKGLLQAQASLDSISRKLYNRIRITQMPDPPQVTKNTIQRASAGLQVLTEYMESQVSNIQEQGAALSLIAQEKSLRSLKQARRGLDRLIDMMGGDSSSDVGYFGVGKDEFIPLDKLNGGNCEKCIREGRRRMRERKVEKRSKWGRFQDALHHAAVQFVI